MRSAYDRKFETELYKVIRWLATQANSRGASTPYSWVASLIYLCIAGFFWCKWVYICTEFISLFRRFSFLCFNKFYHRILLVHNDGCESSALLWEASHRIWRGAKVNVLVLVKVNVQFDVLGSVCAFLQMTNYLEVFVYLLFMFISTYLEVFVCTRPISFVYWNVGVDKYMRVFLRDLFSHI